jgi:hypothetical protein
MYFEHVQTMRGFDLQPTPRKFFSMQNMVKVNLSLCLNKHLTMQAHGAAGV